MPTAVGFELPRQCAEVDTEKIRPHQEGKHTLPKAQMQEANGEQPSAEPRQAGRRMVLDSYFLDFFYASFVCQSFPLVDRAFIS